MTSKRTSPKQGDAYVKDQIVIVNPAEKKKETTTLDL